MYKLVSKALKDEAPSLFLKKMNFIFTALCCFFLNINSHAQAQSTPLTISKTIYGAGEILIPCQLEGMDQSCKLDMGAPFSVFSVEETKDLNVINQIDYVGVSGISAKCNVVTSTNPVSFGPVSVKDSLFLNCPQRVSRNHLLGLNHLMTRPFKIDFQEQTFSIFEGTEVLNHEYQVDSSGHVFVKIKLIKANQEVEVRAMLDTGAGLTIVSGHLVESLPQFFTSLGTSHNDVKDTNSNVIQNKMVFISTIEIDQKRIAIPYSMVMDFTDLKKSIGFDVDMIIGLNVLRELKTLSINPSNATWSVQ
ncbi:MAG: hypothetical protein M9899_06690 [Bdellovibrionaceae bacterium]|nr:hypothetical protein [Pseudobdellovibrionaceae bacterium]